MVTGRADYTAKGLEKIPAREPVFIIRAQDILGPVVLEYYAKQAEALQCDMTFVESVIVQAERMRDWQQRVKVKRPNL